MAGPEQAKLILVSEDGPAPATISGEFLVALDAGDPEFAILREWEAKQSVLDAVVPNGSRIIRPRSLVDLQPLTPVAPRDLTVRVVRPWGRRQRWDASQSGA